MHGVYLVLGFGLKFPKVLKLTKNPSLLAVTWTSVYYRVFIWI